MRLDGKIALISGGASGIGLASARKFIEEGARVVVTDIDGAKARDAAGALGSDTLAFTHDVTDEGQWEQVVADTVARHGRLDILVNSAGIGVAADIEACSYELWRKVQAINATGTFLGCKHAVLAMKQTGGGSIVNISSVLGLRAQREVPAYAASKGAVRLLTKSVALHCARMKYGIRCNSVHPGYIETPMVAPRLDKVSGNVTGREYLEALHPLGRLGRPEEIAAMILFLASDESSFATGAEFTVDGGLTA